jgi:hypothetical protein
LISLSVRGLNSHCLSCTDTLPLEGITMQKGTVGNKENEDSLTTTPKKLWRFTALERFSLGRILGLRTFAEQSLRRSGPGFEFPDQPVPSGSR